MSGYDNTVGGVYGTLGVPAAANVPGARQEAMGWADSSGNLWLFGESRSYDSAKTFGILNDLWEFIPPRNSGHGWVVAERCRTLTIASPVSTAPRESLQPITSPVAVHTPLVGQTLMETFGSSAGPAATPLVLRPCSMIYGSSILPQTSGPGWEVAQGTVHSIRLSWCLWHPGSRLCRQRPRGAIVSGGWTDSRGNLWLFGGEGYDSIGARGYLNDLWEFNPSTNEWTWVSGSSTMSKHQLLSAGHRVLPVRYLRLPRPVWHWKRPRWSDRSSRIVRQQWQPLDLWRRKSGQRS